MKKANPGGKTKKETLRKKREKKTGEKEKENPQAKKRVSMSKSRVIPLAPGIGFPSVKTELLIYRNVVMVEKVFVLECFVAKRKTIEKRKE